ncbi:MAG: hypothetical protein O2954_20010, partial [bacterium]|nr:hypothetical protein [bacterium]
MAGSLAFVEVPSQLPHVPSDFQIISLSPLVEVALEQQGRTFIRPEDYLDESALLQEGLVNYERVETLCGALDTIFADRIPAVKGEGLQPARWHYFWLKKVYDAFFLRAYQVHRVLISETPGEVIYFNRSCANLTREWIGLTESLYAPVLEYLLSALKIPGRQLGSVFEECRPSYSLQKKTLSRLWQMPRRAVQRFTTRAQNLLRYALPFPVQGRVLCLDFESNLPFIQPELERLGLEVWVWSEGSTFYRVGALRTSTAEMDVQLSKDLQISVWAAIEASQLVRDACFVDGLDLWTVMASRFRRLVDYGLPEVLANYASARNILDRIQPDAVLMSVASLPREKTICHVARCMGVPSFVSRHGEAGMHRSPMATYQDIDSVDWALCWGRWEAEWTRRHSRRRTRPIVVGAPVVEAGAKSVSSRNAVRRQTGYSGSRRIALYVPTLSGGNNWYASYMPADNNYYRHCQKVVKAILGLDQWRVVIKEHPGVSNSALEMWCESVDDDGRVSVMRRPGFSELIHFSDIVILDLPSTTLVQALTGGARIYVVNHPLAHWEPEVIEYLVAAGVSFCTSETLGGRLQEDLKSGVLSVPGHNPQQAVEPLADRFTTPGK